MILTRNAGLLGQGPGRHRGHGVLGQTQAGASPGIQGLNEPKGEQTVNLTELTDKTIQENREAADSKTEKQVALAAGVTAGESTSSPAPSPQEGSELAQPDIVDSPYLDVYNTTSQF